MRCKNCKTEFNKGDIFCKKCGQKLNYNMPKSFFSNKKILIIVAMVFIGGSIIAYFIFGNNDDEAGDDYLNVDIKYEVKQTYEREYEVDDTVLYKFYYKRPIFEGDSPLVETLNHVYEKQEQYYKDYSEEYNLVEMHEITKVEYPGEEPVIYGVDCNDPYIKENIISIYQIETLFFESGAPYCEPVCKNFDISSGNEITIDSILDYENYDIKERLLDEIDEVYDMDVRSMIDEDNDDDFRFNQIGTDAKYYLDEEGVHITFSEYTFGFRVAEEVYEILIPYSDEIVKEPYSKDVPISEKSAGENKMSISIDILKDIGKNAGYLRDNLSDSYTFIDVDGYYICSDIADNHGYIFSVEDPNVMYDEDFTIYDKAKCIGIAGLLSSLIGDFEEMSCEEFAKALGVDTFNDYEDNFLESPTRIMEFQYKGYEVYISYESKISKESFCDVTIEKIKHHR